MNALYSALSSLHSSVTLSYSHQKPLKTSQLLHMKISFCSLKKIKTLLKPLKPLMPLELPLAYRLLFLFLQYSALQRRRFKAKEREEKRKIMWSRQSTVKLLQKFLYANRYWGGVLRLMFGSAVKNISSMWGECLKVFTGFRDAPGNSSFYMKEP